MRFSLLCSTALLLSCGPLLLPVDAQENAKKAELPVKRVVMFSSGVAFYEHTAM